MNLFISRSILMCFLQLILIVFRPLIVKASGDTTYFFIARDGSSKNNGTILKPFSSLEDARDAIRKVRKKSGINKPVVVYIREGVYYLNKSFRLTEADAVSEKESITYKAFGKEYVELNGGISVNLDMVKKVENKSVLQRLPASARSQILEIPLIKMGIRDLGNLHSAGFRRPYYPSALEIFINKSPMTVARYPNDSGEIIKEVLQTSGTIRYNDLKPLRWLTADDPWMGGTFCWAWADDQIPILKIDTVNRTITTKEASMFNFSAGEDYRRWYVFNLLEEIDMPGEYYIDRKLGMLYFFPPPQKNKLIELSMMEEPIISMIGVKNTIFKNINIENTRGMGVYMEGGGNNSLKGCTFRNIGMVPVVIGKGIKPFKQYLHNGTGEPVSEVLGSWHEHLFDNSDFDRQAGKNNGIEGCKIYNAGWGGVSLGGGNRKTLEAAKNYVVNCDIYNINRLAKTYRGAVNIDGVGNIIKGNHLHNTSQIAVYIHGNDHIIEYNEVNNACLDAEDMGAFYMGRDPSETGFSIRFNYLHDISAKNQSYRLAGMYFDDGSYGQNIYGNIFYRVGNKDFGAVFVHGGHDFVFENNIFIDCERALGNVPWDDEKWKNNLSSDLWKSRLYLKVNIGAISYSKSYPNLALNLKKSNRVSIAKANFAINCKESFPGQYQLKNNYLLTDSINFKKLNIKDLSGKKYTEIFSALPTFRPIPFKDIGEGSVLAGNPYDKYKRDL